MRAAVLGAPIAHSRSPVLHLAAYRALGLDDWQYTAIECDALSLPAFIDGLGPNPASTAPASTGWAGLSLTMPLKRAVLPLLDHADPLVTETGGANTVVFTAQGRHGYNTDVAGMVAALAGAGVRKADGATILGGGATACSALAALRELGLAEARVLVRDQARAGGLLAAASRLGMVAELAPFAAGTRDGDLLISTLPAAAPVLESQRTSLIPSAAALLDVVYHPWPTPLAVTAAAAGIPVASGFDLLLHQAARQVELMTGRVPAPVAEMRAALIAAL